MLLTRTPFSPFDPGKPGNPCEPCRGKKKGWGHGSDRGNPSKNFEAQFTLKESLFEKRSLGAYTGETKT